MNIETLPRTFKNLVFINNYGNFKNIITQKKSFLMKIQNKINIKINIDIINNFISSKLLKFKNIYEQNEEIYWYHNKKIKIIDENSDLENIDFYILFDIIMELSDLFSIKDLLIDKNDIYFCIKNNSYKVIILNFTKKKNSILNNRMILIEKLLEIFKIKTKLNKKFKSKKIKKDKIFQKCNLYETLKLDTELANISINYVSEIILKIWHFYNCINCLNKENILLNSFNSIRNNISNKFSLLNANFLNIDNLQVLKKPSIKFIKKMNINMIDNFDMKQLCKLFKNTKKVENLSIELKSKELFNHNLTNMLKILINFKYLKKLNLNFERNYLTNDILKKIYKYFKNFNLKYLILKLDENLITEITYFLKLINKNNKIKKIEFEVGNKNNKIILNEQIILDKKFELISLKISNSTFGDNFDIIFDNSLNSLEISFNNCNINNKLIFKWINRIKNWVSLKKLILNLTRNDFDDVGLSFISKEIQNLKSLKFFSLFIFGNSITSKGLNTLINNVSKLNKIEKLTINYLDYLNPRQFDNKEKSQLKKLFDNLRIKDKIIY